LDDDSDTSNPIIRFFSASEDTVGRCYLTSRGFHCSFPEVSLKKAAYVYEPIGRSKYSPEVVWLDDVTEKFGFDIQYVGDPINDLPSAPLHIEFPAIYFEL
jgi:hypothetical protein